MKEIKSESNLPAASFEDFFIVDDNLVKKENSADIDMKINKNLGLYYFNPNGKSTSLETALTSGSDSLSALV